MDTQLIYGLALALGNGLICLILPSVLSWASNGSATLTNYGSTTLTNQS